MAVNNQNDDPLLKYTGLALQFLVGIGLCVFFGIKADGWMHLHAPLLVWLLPLVFICALLYKIVKETSSKK